MRSLNRNRRRARRQGGFVLIVVLMIIVIMTMTATLLVEQGTTTSEVSSAVKTYAIAQQRAQMGMMQMRAETLNSFGALSALAPCPNIQAAEAGTCPRIVLVNGADATGLVDVPFGVSGTADLSEGAGLQYRAFVFNAGPGTGDNGRYFIVSTGFYGWSAATGPAGVATNNTREARIEVELSLPSGVKEKVCPSGVAGSC